MAQPLVWRMFVAAGGGECSDPYGAADAYSYHAVVLADFGERVGQCQLPVKVEDVSLSCLVRP
ncbi:hypothetical protein OG883_45195 [Streptomyces sp. NBC_01142]|uniref:hypothetical protein n=1 Tax=Streptomyces sp. NBC_01142 TaxID=2975865 RepID=UPI0022512481|nr:hypothetical protein [Streptomyces sp. NBC_01142]MCX4826836.1 hypothetical protein [Streptomyces sp. NBC_01142]